MPNALLAEAFGQISGVVHSAFQDASVDVLANRADLARIVDTSWDPPVTLAVRLISILSDDLQHAGQTSYVRGLAIRAGL